MSTSKSIIAARIREQLEKHKMSGNEASRRSGAGLGLVRDILSGKTANPRIDSIKSLAGVFGVSAEYLLGHIDTFFPEESGSGTRAVNVIGKAGFGIWSDPDTMSIKEMTVNYPIDSRFPNEEYHGYQVDGDSADLVAAPGAVCVCVNIDRLTDGITVIVERTMPKLELIERAVCSVKKMSGGRWALTPATTNPKAKPFSAEKDTGDEELRIVGKVIGSIKIIH